MLTTFNVNVDYDAIAPFNLTDSIVTLREAVFQANQFPDADTINFDAGLDGGTILLTQGELNITESVTIDASSLSGDLTIDASGNDNDVNLDNGGGTSVFYIDVQTGPTEPHIIEFAGLTITGGDTPGDGGGIKFEDLFYGTTGITTLTIRDSVITGNSSGNKGGGVYAHSYNVEVEASTFLVDISGSSIENNTAAVSGGGLYIDLDGNHADSEGAALTLVDSSVTGNVATNNEGGGVWFCAKFGGSVNATNSTISGNSATGANGQGGGLWISRFDSPSEPDTIANLDHVTITNNSSPDGGGLFSDVLQGVFTTLNNTIVSGNDDGNGVANNIAGQIEAASDYNLIGQGQVVPANLTGAGNILDSDNNPDLMPLDFYGGPTKTHMPIATSQVVDAGDPAAVAQQNGIPRYDQRGRAFSRVLNGRIDIGAVEYGLGDPTKAPTVVDIVISGSNSVHADYSFSEAFEEGIHEFTTVPVGGADTIEVVFSEWVDVSEASILLYGLDSGTMWDIVDFVFDDDTFTARFRFDNTGDGQADTFLADIFGLSLSSSLIQDSSGLQLDGEWDWPDGLLDESPESFPSGNGTAGGWFGFTFVILPGDSNLSNSVSGSGFLWWQTHYDPNGTDNTFTDGDFDGDGDVDGEDLALWQANFGLNFTSW